jgi:S-DNA-T family DNA segregation ATPase FtsK/SpoIIIE
MIDPKILEFSRYAKDKNLRYEIATTPKHADAVLLHLTDEMDKRLKMLKEAGCRDLREYRAKTGHGSYIVVFIDELSDLMQASGKRFEESLCRLAQKARAAGIHIVQATQYPKADIVTSKIKANFDGRICFKVVDAPQSRVMLGDKNNAAAYLEGKGDAYISGSRFQMQRFRGALVKSADRPKPGLFSAVTNMLTPMIS